MLTPIEWVHDSEETKEYIFLLSSNDLWCNFDLCWRLRIDIMQEQSDYIWEALMISNIRVLVPICSQYSLYLVLIGFHKCIGPAFLKYTCSFDTIFVDFCIKVRVFKIRKLLVNSLMSLDNLINFQKLTPDSSSLWVQNTFLTEKSPEKLIPSKIIVYILLSETNSQQHLIWYLFLVFILLNYQTMSQVWKILQFRVIWRLIL